MIQFNGLYDIRSLQRPKIADAVNDGAECASARSFIPLKEQTTCNVDDCPDGENHKAIKVLVILPMNI